MTAAKSAAKQMTVDVISLGCSKNLVDSERLLAQLDSMGIKATHDAPNPHGDVAVINTCAFIGDAKEESIDMILGMAERKKARKLKRLYVMGCLPERYKDELAEAIPEVDGFYGKFDWPKLFEELGKEYRADLRNDRIITTPSHYAYLKISEGCNRFCTYCAIPIITGRHTSRPMEEILDEAKRLADGGVKELQVIAQDLSSYGTDLYKTSKLAELTHRLTEINGIEWVRLHYAYPADFPFDILPEMASNPKVCNYLDLALQHISDNMLKTMHRHITKQQTLDLLSRIRSEVPGIHIRTTFICGHPGETDKDHEELMQFVESQRFERMGAFTYSHEEDTYAWKNYKDDIPEETKERYKADIMELQETISTEINEQKVGSVMRVIIDRYNKEENIYYGRTEFDSPEVDGEVLIKGDKKLKVGNFYDVRITSADQYDLFGELNN
ncbi:MAG: 30S ribosomal protein S12 methylthiotransferase RimO [Bacteroidales bacterium]|jgi:ribosomal protein S12 methylthiotransferase|nr:30S ribosomal protein S12 methylthiotransferase RimO [Bacteroidales bacterium]